MIELVEEGLLLEDFESIHPEKLNDHIIKMKIGAYSLMKHLKHPQSKIKKWID
ncbi:DUF3969 family protein [Erysipelothrix sp. HDW6C]|nr:DUF3969 family protein [Erysipelothrix sp. HDW6C]